MEKPIESMSYVTYEYSVYPRKVEKHVSSNIIKTPIYGADIKIYKKSISLIDENKDIIKFNIIIKNEGDKEAKNLKLNNILNNLIFIKGTLTINESKISNYDFKNEFLFKSLKASGEISLSFNAKINKFGDFGSLMSGFYYFLDKYNNKIYRAVSSNLINSEKSYPNIEINVSSNDNPILLNCKKDFFVCIKNTGNMLAENVTLTVLTPKELEVDYDSFHINSKQIKAIDKYSFEVGNIDVNDLKNIQFKIKFIEFKNRFAAPIAIYCNFNKNFDSDICRSTIKLNPTTY